MLVSAPYHHHHAVTILNSIEATDRRRLWPIFFYKNSTTQKSNTSEKRFQKWISHLYANRLSQIERIILGWIHICSAIRHGNSENSFGKSQILRLPLSSTSSFHPAENFLLSVICVLCTFSRPSFNKPSAFFDQSIFTDFHLFLRFYVNRVDLPHKITLAKLNHPSAENFSPMRARKP